MKHRAFVTPKPGGLVQLGPLVQVTLSPNPAISEALSAQGLPVPRRTVKLMVDTGAQSTLVDKSVVESLGVSPTAFQPVIGVSGVPEQCPVFPLAVSLGFDDGSGTIAELTFAASVIGMPPMSPSSNCHGLIGRDFLAHMELFYDGPNGEIELRIPRGRLTSLGLPAAPKSAGPGTGKVLDAKKAQRRRQRRARKKQRG